MTDPRYAAADRIVLRIAALPVGAFGGPGPRAVRCDPEGPDEETAAYVTALASHPVLREAVELAGDSLALTLRQIERGRAPRHGRLVAAAAALTKYALRITRRPTPFGTFAGVALAELTPVPYARIGAAHRKSVRPDAGWFAGAVDACVAQGGPVDDTEVVVNDLCLIRGDRLHLAWTGSADGAAARRERSVRLGPAVRFVYERAAVPVRFGTLAGELAEHGPAPSARWADLLLRRLVTARFLLTSLMPEVIDAAALDELPQRTDPGARAAPGEAREALDAYARTPPGEGLGELRRAKAVLRGVRESVPPPLQTDLRADAEVGLPPAVGRELEHLAASLWRMSPHRGILPHLDAYAESFAERYGDGSAVPLPELTDPHRGLGLPDAAAHRRPRPEEEPRRAATLARLVHDALRGGGEALLDEETLRRLEVTHDGEPGPASLELFAQVLAPSLPALEAGDFTLLLSPSGGSESAGASAGRFAGLLGTREVADLLAEPVPPGAVRAQVMFEPAGARHRNISQVPRLLDHVLPVGIFADRSAPGTLDWRRLAVVADRGRLRLVEPERGREIVVRKPHLLGASALPPLVRFLLELSTARQSTWSPWRWGAMDAHPFLPRVRHGRVVVAPARWRPSPDMLGTDGPTARWRAAFEEWRSSLGVARHVLAAAGDRVCALDLDEPLHREVLRQELRDGGVRDGVVRDGGVEVYEDLAAGPGAFGWLGGRAHEIAVSLTRLPDPAPPRPRPGPGGEPSDRLVRAPSPRPAEPPPVPPARAQPAELPPAPPLPVHSPGGEWLCLKLYAAAPEHDRLLAGPLGRLLESARESGHTDRWFFTRYRDPAPHLRLRLHGDPAVLLREVLPALHTGLTRLRDSGLAGDWVLDGYRPERRRYGGPAALALAEEVFALDSRAALGLIPVCAAAGPELPSEIVAAAQHGVLLDALGDWPWWEWVDRHYPNTEEGRRFYRRHRAAALTRIVPGRCLRAFAGLPGAGAAAELWARSAAPRRFGEAVIGGRPGERAATAVDGLLHMQHNRLIGTDRAHETRTLAVLRGVARDHLGRSRHGSAASG
ncbi:lantibiotic dehydratase [Streptomyces sp. NPDC020141]|uniref:lantibiotic dehydratase n=1 Tax=Streptomyces sp. NPDC020141 TaxID=3365065 RepID=UPI0037A12CD6